MNVHLNFKTMKKTFFITVVMVVLGFIHGYGQGLQVYPIPSYNVDVNGFANFRETTQFQALVQPAEKRVLDVQVKTVSGSNDCQATIWVYTLDNSILLGPYTVYCNQPYQVAIDPSELWGVLVDMDEDLLVSVWID